MFRLLVLGSYVVSMSTEWCAGQGLKSEDGTLLSSSSKQLGGERSGNQLQENYIRSKIPPVTLQSLLFR